MTNQTVVWPQTRLIASFLGMILAVFLPLVGQLAAQEHKQPQSETAAQPKRPYTISKETTYFIGPLKPDGSIDFIAAVNEHFSRGFTAENNAARIIVPMLDPESWGTPDLRDQWLRRLGLDPAEHPPEAALRLSIFNDQEMLPDRETFLIQFDAAREQGLWTDDQFPLVADWLAENEPKFERIVEGARLSKFFIPLRPADGPDSFWPMSFETSQGLRQLARMFAVRAYNRLANGQSNKAWSDVLTIKGVSEHASRGPMLIDCLVGDALHGMACGIAVDFIAHGNEGVKWDNLLSSWEIGPVATISDGFATGERAYVGYVVCDHLATSESIGKSLDIFNFGEQPDALAAVVGKFRQALLEQAFANGEINLDDTFRLGNQYYDQVAVASDLKNAQEREAALNQLESLLDGDDDESDEPAIARVLPEIRVIAAKHLQRPF